MRRIWTWTIALLLALCILPGTARAAEVVAEGTCGAEGDNLTWVLTDDGVLTISGNGAMADYTSSTKPWNSYKSTIQSVVIEQGVASIGKSAFYSCKKLVSVSIPDSVLSIGEAAFQDCESLTGVVIPGSVLTIGSTAFYDCESLTEMIVPNSVTSLGNYAFCGCTNLINAVIGESVPEIGYGLFSGCKSLSSVAIPASAVSLGSSAFNNCTSLADVYFMGTERAWNKMVLRGALEDGNECLANAVIHFGAEDEVRFDGGNGTDTNPYLVSTAEQLNAVRDDLMAHYVQMADIDLAGMEWEPIGYRKVEYAEDNSISRSTLCLFSGSYNGNDHKISNLKITQISDIHPAVGLFGYNEGKLSNINLANIDMTISCNEDLKSYIYIGGIAGYCEEKVDILITNCSSSGNINFNLEAPALGYVGGIVGIGSCSYCKNSSNIFASISSESSKELHCGGITGYPGRTSEEVTYCINYGNVAGETYLFESQNHLRCGGITGEDGSLINCVNFGNISGHVYSDMSISEYCCVGGLSGETFAGNGNYSGLFDCVNFGDVSAYTAYEGTSCCSGGLFGYFTGGEATNCYNVASSVYADLLKYGDEYICKVGRIYGRGGGTMNGCYSIDSTILGAGEPREDELGAGVILLSAEEIYAAIANILRSLDLPVPGEKQEFNGHYYKVIDQSMTWTEAKAYCESQGGYLAVITTEEEQRFIESLLRYGTKNTYWIGLREEGTSWSWITGEPFSYTNWAGGEPNNSGGTENVVQMYGSDYSTFYLGQWNDSAVNGSGGFHQLESTGFVCEYETRETASGTCGDNLTWTLKDDGTLTISGTGDMYDYELTGANLAENTTPWFAYRQMIKKVVVENGVSRIGAFAFDSLGSMLSISLPDTLNEIGPSAFGLCDSLRAIYFEGNVEKWMTLREGDKGNLKNAAILYNGHQFDIWGFDNSTNHWAEIERGRFISSEDYLKATGKLSKTDRERFTYNKSGASYFNIDGKTQNHEPFLGFCHGYSAWVCLAQKGALSPSNIENGQSRLLDFSLAENQTVESAINFYYGQQYIKKFDKKVNAFLGEFFNNQRSQVETLESLGKIAEETGELFLINYQWHPVEGNSVDTSKGSAHSVVGYGWEQIEATPKELQGTNYTYTHRILVFDCADTDQSDDTNIYYNDDGVWCIPGYNIVSTSSNKRDEYGNNGQLLIATSDSSIINLIDYNSPLKYDKEDLEFVTTLTTSSDASYSVRWGENSAEISGFSVNSQTEGEIFVALAANMTTDGECYPSTATAFLSEGEQTYTVESNEDTMEFALSVGHYYTRACMNSAGLMTFYEDGSVDIQADNASVIHATLVSDDGYYDLPWYKIEISGTGATEVSTEKTDNGILVHCDNMDTITVAVTDDNGTTEITTGTEKDTILITESDGQLSVQEDANGDGVFDTDITDGPEKVDPEQPDVSSIIRIAGDDRIATSLMLAGQLKEVLGVEKFDAVVVASALNFPDALTGSYLTAEKDAPILLTYPAAHAKIRAYIQENLKPGGMVYILGGEGAVSADFANGLGGFNIKRLAGSDRFGTNLEIMKEAGNYSGKPVLIATAVNFADSLSASAAGLPMVLVYGSLREDQKEFLSTTSKNFIIIGGEAAVSPALEAELKAIGSVTRVAGSSRYETSVLVAERFAQNSDAVILAYAKNFPDGLCGGPLAYALGAPLILTDSGAPGTADAYVENITAGIVVGGAGLISDAATRDIFDLAANAHISTK